MRISTFLSRYSRNSRSFRDALEPPPIATKVLDPGQRDLKSLPPPLPLSLRGLDHLLERLKSRQAFQQRDSQQLFRGLATSTTPTGTSGGEEIGRPSLSVTKHILL